jgi:transposase
MTFVRKRIAADETEEYQKRKRGQPTAYRPEYCERVFEHMKDGYSLTSFAGSIKRSVDTIYEWIATHPEFSESVKQGQAARTGALERRLLSANNGGQAATSIFALKNACPAEWREVRYENIEHNVNINVLSDEQLAAIAMGRPAESVISAKYERLPKPSK